MPRPRAILALALACALATIQRVEARPNAMDYIHMARTDFYGALEVDKRANATTIARSYRKLALQYHPDKFPPGSDARARRAATERFKVMAEAKTVLLDAERRAEYDAVIDSLPGFARPRYGRRSFADREVTRVPAWIVIGAFAMFCVGFVSVAQYTSREADKQSLMNSLFFQQKLRQRNKNVPNSEKVSAAVYFEEFLIEHGLADLTGWEHTLGGRLLARARGRPVAPLPVAPQETAEASESTGNKSASEDQASAALRRRGKKKGKGKPSMSADARREQALRRIRAEGEARRAWYGESYDDE